MIRTGPTPAKGFSRGNTSSQLSPQEAVITRLVHAVGRLTILGLLMSAPFFTGCGAGTATTTTPASIPDNGPEATLSPAAGTVTLTWDATTTRTDGSPLDGAVSYKLYYGTTPGANSSIIEVSSGTTCTINNLTPGTYYFVMTAYDILGGESGYSNEVSRTITQ